MWWGDWAKIEASWRPWWVCSAPSGSTCPSSDRRRWSRPHQRAGSGLLTHSFNKLILQLIFNQSRWTSCTIGSRACCSWSPSCSSPAQSGSQVHLSSSSVHLSPFFISIVKQVGRKILVTAVPVKLLLCQSDEPLSIQGLECVIGLGHSHLCQGIIIVPTLSDYHHHRQARTPS